jgi:hypothetical protein
MKEGEKEIYKMSKSIERNTMGIIKLNALRMRQSYF